MSWQHSIYGDILLITSAIAAFIAMIAWQRRSGPGGVYLAIFMWSACMWALTGALEAFVRLPDEKAFWSQISYFGIVHTAPAWFCFTLSYCDLEKYLTRRFIAFAWIIPVITLAAALTNSYHHLLWPSTRLEKNPFGEFMYYEHGPAVWLYIVYSYILNSIATYLLLRQSSRMFKLHQKQAMALIAAGIIPWIGNFIYNARIGIPSFDPTPISFTATGVILTWTIAQYRLFDISPVAREALFVNLTDMVIVLDVRHRVIDMNASAQELLHLPSIPAGREAMTALAAWRELAAFGTSAEEEHESVLSFQHSGGTVEWFEARRSPLLDKQGRMIGRLIICRNITKRKLAEQDRDRVIDELQEALAKVKTLSGFLPICASCKKIRDDAGYWQQVEQYISTHTDAQFTHGMCPECIEKFFPTLNKKSL